MNDKDFDKVFGDKLREECSFSSVDKDWELLSSRLDTASQVKKEDNRWRKAAWLLLLLVPFFALLLWQMNDIKNQNKQLATQLSALQTQLSDAKIQHDTLVRKEQKIDTIAFYKYRNTPNNEGKSNESTSFLGKNKSEKSSSIPSVKDGFLNETELVLGNNLTNAGAISSLDDVKGIQDTTKPRLLNDEKKITELTEKLADLDKQIADLKQALADQKISAAHLADCATKQDSLKKQLREATALTDSLKITPLSKINENRSKSVINKRLFIGVQGGQIIYKSTWFTPIGVEVSKNLKSYQTGLKLEYAVTDKIRLTAGGDFCPVSFLINWQDRRYNLPATEFNPQKEKYLSAEAKQTVMQGNLGAKYFFTEGGAKWRPFVGAAYTTMRINSYETKFTYQSLGGPVNREQIVQSNAVNVPNLLLMSGGLEYRFSKYIVAQTEAFYYKDINKTHKTFDLFGLRAAVLLNIK